MLRLTIFFNVCLVLLQVSSSADTTNENAKPSTDAAIKVTYPRHIQKQFKKLIYKPKLPFGYGDRQRAPFHPAWMDYCDPYHCNDYYKEVCGLNRKKMKFRYFQSGCHLILNNMCSNYRGSLKYDMVDLKFCRVYVMFLRMSCPSDCSDESVDPVCGYSTTRGHTVLFLNQCSLDAANCGNNTQEYEPIKLSKCEKLLLLHKSNLSSRNTDETIT